MNKFKKLIVIAISMVMALALAVPAFADDATAKAKLKEYLATYGIDAGQVIDALTPEQISEIKAKQGSLEALVANTYAEAQANPDKAQSIVDNAVAQIGVTGVSIKKVTVTPHASKVTGEFAVQVGNDVIPGTSAIPLDQESENSGSANNTVNNTTSNTVNNTANNNTGAAVNNVSAPAVVNPMTVSGTSVIKATGDNSAVVVVAAVLAVVAVLGLGFRKNSSMTVA